ncbi:hypothetical protein [Bradyrhizobium yuanmingense]|uniref:hypothetical protein n=1 Tax=Bradyrhizobium yuanmingense TaxID=108015 RepID=UPI0023B9E7B1|nr:hypothetical protein [Bradyrhizobium yuanmingense]MDF0492760.1 hypothetical protein [Bradyrhizobium yuanmingense]
MIHLQSQDQELVYSCAVRGRLERRKGIGSQAEVLDLSPRLLDAAGCFVEPVVSMEYTGGDRLLWKLQRYCEHTPASVEEFRLFGMRKFDIVFGAPSRIEEYLNWATSLSFMPRPRLVITTFEELTPTAASRFGLAFDAPVVNLYGATETGFIAASDQGAWPLRVEQDFAVVEVLKIDSDEPAMVGEVGRIVVTSLRSRVMPIIRYDIGDLAELVEEDDLGLGVARSLGRLVGRTSVTFVTRLGIKVGAGRVLDAIKALEVWPFQVVQRAAGQLMLKLDPSVSKETAGSLCARLKADTPELFVDSFDLFFDDGPFEHTVAGKRLLAVQQMLRE